MNDLPNNDTPLPQIKGYRLLRVINHGGMSIVYLAEQLALSREVAIKVMQPQALSDEVSRRRFENEVRTISLAASSAMERTRVQNTSRKMGSAARRAPS